MPCLSSSPPVRPQLICLGAPQDPDWAHRNSSLGRLKGEPRKSIRPCVAVRWLEARGATCSHAVLRVKAAAVLRRRRLQRGERQRRGTEQQSWLHPVPRLLGLSQALHDALTTSKVGFPPLAARSLDTSMPLPFFKNLPHLRKFK